MNLNIIGCGKVGKTLAKLWLQAGLLRVGGILNASYERAVAAAAFIGEGVAVRNLDELPPATITLIATPDDKIAAVAEQLKLNAGQVVFHCSGNYASDILQGLQTQGVQVASVHPVRSFAQPETAVRDFANTYCTLEGDEYAVNLLQPLFEKIEAQVVAINPDLKSRYHLASVLANNYLVTLHYHAYQSYLAAGLEPRLAKALTADLMTQALQHLNSASHYDALTGPIKRGDIGTLEKHLALLANEPTLRQLYQSLGLATRAFLPDSTCIPDVFWVS